MANHMNFIRTTDSETAAQLRDLGLYEVQETGANEFIFVNNPLMNFELNGLNLDKFRYTNRLNL